MKSDRALKTKDENASYYPTSLLIEIKNMHNEGLVICRHLLKTKTKDYRLRIRDKKDRLTKVSPKLVLIDAPDGHSCL